MGSKKSTTTQTQQSSLSKLYRPFARRGAEMAEREFTGALEASRNLDVSDPALRDAVRDEYLRTVRGEYTQAPYVDALAGRAADIAQRGIAGGLRRYGGGAYASAILDARQRAALGVMDVERGRQFGALGMGPEQYDLATAPQRDIYRRQVADPTRLASGYTQALATNPLAQENRMKGKTTTKQPFDWGGFFAGLAGDAFSAGLGMLTGGASTALTAGIGGASNSAGAPYYDPTGIA